MTYQEKINASQELYNAIQAMEEDNKLYIQYGKEYYEIRCHTYGIDKSWAIYERDNILSRGMNVDSLTKTTMTLYSYDLFNNKTTHRLPLYQATLIKA